MSGIRSNSANAYGGYYSNTAFYKKKADAKSGRGVDTLIGNDEMEAVLKEKDPELIGSKNEAKLSQKAQDFLKSLRQKYGNFDFMVGDSTDDLQALSKSGRKEFSVIFSSAEIEKMANDEDYAAEKMRAVENSVNMCLKICEQQGYESAFGADNSCIGNATKIGLVVDDNGNMKFFAELEKTSDKQKERIEKAREKKAEEKKTAKERVQKNPYEKEEKETVKRTTIEAGSYDELLDKLQTFDWSKVADSKSGDRFDFSV